MSYSFKRDSRSQEFGVEHRRFRFSCYMKWILIGLVLLFLVLFVLIFIVFPIVFMVSLALERFFLFMNVNVPKNPQFDKPHEYGFYGVTNFYITSRVDLNSSEVLSIGTWWLPHEKYINSTESMDDILKRNEYPVVLYNHGVMATRILGFDYIYNTLRKYFHVLAIDYRVLFNQVDSVCVLLIGDFRADNTVFCDFRATRKKKITLLHYGDSTSHDLSEHGVVLDVVHAYNLMKLKTKADIFIWGHSLGGGISASAIKWLKEYEGEIPSGLVIESSFTSLQDEIYEFFLAKYFKWLPWFESCVIRAVRDHGFIFNTTKNIEDIDCPIMIMHAEDDPVIPFFLGQKNFNITSQSRKPYQGNVSFHSFAAEKGYGHVGCTQDPEVPEYIENFLAECEEWKRDRDLNLMKKPSG